MEGAAPSEGLDPLALLLHRACEMACTDIEGMAEVDEIPDLIETLEDLIRRLEARWADEWQ